MAIDFESPSLVIRARINGNIYRINKQQTHVNLKRVWFPIYEDQEGDAYILMGTKTQYIELEIL